MKRRTKSIEDTCHGAITAFLVVILVPCIVFVSVFTDLSRVQLSRSEAASTADLALYTVLAHYDPQLKELYGLMGSVQDSEQFISSAEKYFKTMMSAANVSDYQSTFAWDTVKGLMDGADPANFLRIEFPDDSTDISVMPGGTLANAALLEDGIVEFMKYHGAITIVDKLMSRFKSMDFTDVEDAKNYEPVKEAKQEFVEAEGELMKDAFYLYFAMRQYQTAMEEYSKAVGYPASADFYKHYKDFETKLIKIWNDLPAVTVLITTYYAATAGINNMNFRPAFTSSFTDSEIKEELKNIARQDDEDESVWYLTMTKYDELTKEFDKRYQEVINVVSEITQGINEVESGDNSAIYMMRIQNKLGNAVTRLNSAVAELQKITKKISAAIECESDPEEPIEDISDPTLSSRWNQVLKDLISGKASQIANNYGNNNFITQTNKYLNCNPNAVVNKVNNRLYTFKSDYLSGEVTLREFAESVSTYLSDEYNYCEKQIENLKRVLEGGTIKRTDNSEAEVIPLHKLKEKARNYSRTLNNWSSEAESLPDNETAQNDLSDIGKIKTGKDSIDATGKDVTESISEQSVEEMETRLRNIRADLSSIKSALDKFTYGGLAVKNLSGEDHYISAAIASVVPTSPLQISVSIAECKAKGLEYAKQLLSPQDITSIYKVPNNYLERDPNLFTVENATDKNLYVQLNTQFSKKSPDAIDDEVSKNDQRIKEYKEMAKNKKASALEYNTYIKDDIVGTSIKSNDTDTVSTSVIEALVGIINLVKNVVSGSGDELRDHIYVTEYIMDMFTHATYLNESFYARAKEDNLDYHAKDISTVQERYRDQFKVKEVTEKTDNLTLTNYLRSGNNNDLFLGEVEYILFGQGSLKGNIDKSLQSIFTIRFALNELSGFMNFYHPGNTTADIIESIAVAVAGLTAGVVPVPVTKVLLITILATIESALDLDYLKRGVPVTLYKLSDEDWGCSIANAKDSAGGVVSGQASFNSELTSGSKPEDPNGLYYSDYLYLFLLMGTETHYSGMLKRIGTVIEANMPKNFNIKEFSLSKANVYYQLHSKVKVKPLMLTIPLIRSFNENGANVEDLIESDDWCTYELDVIRGYS